MERTFQMKKNYIWIGILVFVMLLSVVLSKITAAPEFHEKTITSLDEKKVRVAELTAATAAASVALAAVPGDSTTPISNQISELSSKLLLVVSAIMLEKSLVCLLDYLTFTWLLPFACLFGILYVFFKKLFLKKLAVGLGVLGAVICLIIPASVKVSNLIDESLNVDQTIEAAAQMTNEIGQAAEEEAEEEEKGIGQKIADLKDEILDGFTGTVDKLEDAVGNLMDAVAALLITSCAIPLVVLLIFVWIVKIVVGLFVSK